MADEQTIDEYSSALDTMGPPGGYDGPEEPEDTGAYATATADALGVTEAPSAKSHFLLDQHPEIAPDYEEAVLEKLIIREAYPPIKADKAEKQEKPEKQKAHTTYPFLNVNEKAKILGFRASQLAHGAPPFIEVPDYLTDVYEISRAELEAKRLPYILKRPLPNGTYEYWRLADLMII
jgi:DNA-directed RNA polymerase I, II, and III subunit RPABC2